MLILDKMTALLIILAILGFAVWKVRTSKSEYFLQPIEKLQKDWEIVQDVLETFDIETHDFLFAFAYFVDNPTDFDGATIVRDLHMIKGLDPFAMKHDYLYLQAGSLSDRLKADNIYIKDMLQARIHPFTAYSRGVILMFINIIGIYKLYKLFTK